MGDEPDSQLRRASLLRETLRVRSAVVYGLYAGLIAIELVLAASPGGRPYNGVGALLAVALIVLQRA